MRREFAVGMFALGLLAHASAGFAQKSTAASSTEVVFGPFGLAAFNSSSSIVTPFQDVLVTTIKPAGGKDLFINVSMETGIFAVPTLINNPQPAPGFALTIAQPETQLQVRVLMDCQDCAKPYSERLAVPGLVNFENLLRSALHFNAVGQDSITDPVTQLGVRSFAFVARDVGVGVHTIRVQARFATSAQVLSVNGFAFAGVQARIGTRTATVEEVKLDAQ
jgi:hypothetical protein